MRRTSNRPALLFFTAHTSGPARRMDSLVAHFARKERSRLRVLRIDADEHGELVARLAVSQVPALVLVKGGRAVGRLEGRATGIQIEEMIRAHVV